MQNPDSFSLDQAAALLKKYFGYDAFRPAQLPVVRSLLAGRDTVAIMPTGAGKSICFQVPALLFPGVTLVISTIMPASRAAATAACAAAV